MLVIDSLLYEIGTLWALQMHRKKGAGLTISGIERQAPSTQMLIRVACSIGDLRIFTSPGKMVSRCSLGAYFTATVNVSAQHP
eukprot:5715612-Amphidinium_carterae.1